MDVGKGWVLYRMRNTHTISRTCHGDHWIVALWDKRKRQYLAFRRAVSVDEQKVAVNELKELAREPAVQV